MDGRNFWGAFTLKISFIILVVILSLSLSLYSIMNNQYQETIIESLREDALVVYAYVEDILDSGSLIAFDTIEDEENELYLSSHEKMDEIRRIANIRYLYTAKQRYDGEYIYVLDGLDPDAEDFRHVGDPIEDEILPELKRCLDGEVIMGDNIMNTEWGIVYVTYFPVHDSEGGIIGAIGMEFDCEYLYYSLVGMQKSTAIVTCILAVLCSSVAMAILRQSVKKAESKLLENDKLLVSAKEEALRSNRAKSVFLSHISHEIRTPLNAIIGMAVILKDIVSDRENALFSVNHILLSSNHLLSLLNNVLDMSKIESGKLELACMPFRLLDACAEASEIITQRCLEKNISFTNNFSEITDTPLIGDKLRINQVLINLLSNAVKFTPEGGKISCEIHKTGETDTFIQYKFAVSDNGIGMSEEQITKLFIPFEQTDASIAVQYGGTGLGLSISQNLVMAMGGQIQVESQLNAGTRFYFEINLEKSEAADDSFSSTSSIVELRGRRILLVEDIEINRIIIHEILSATGIDIQDAENGKLAVEMFEKMPAGYFDLILMDVQMPIMDGYEATKQIRQCGHEDSARIPIVSMTANAYKEDVDRALAAGMNAHLAKPINVELLMDAIKRYITIREK